MLFERVLEAVAAEPKLVASNDRPSGSASIQEWTAALPRRGGYRVAKRVFDVVASLLLGLLVLPLLLVVALLIKLDSRGPVFFVQDRVRARRPSRSGVAKWRTEPFPFYKLRTMYVDADTRVHERYMAEYMSGHVAGPGEGGTYKLNNDARITRVGRLLRKYSIDELPQLWNVLRGDMSLVGPRPALPYEVARYETAHLGRLMCPPGLTGWWQVKGRALTAFDEMVALDLEYVRRCSILMDLRILVVTVPAVLSGRGAE